ncbi:hypothetical protein TB9_01045 [Xanthomonas perforans]|nr:hypothetical protein XP1511_05260 [Xanthomonas perforans]KLC73716.1 hypothetical protein GEV915_21530 [Xanthomonas perforans]KLC96633.1 hypothetical protein GEV936_00510 [Xanthomonas perforans]KLD12171.1 hypothetical protein GEV1054_21170 [Xanthomonas perforans]KLD14019.1 hypothetical protein GEV1026_10450 [Xanthomonas perforans]
MPLTERVDVQAAFARSVPLLSKVLRIVLWIADKIFSADVLHVTAHFSYDLDNRIQGTAWMAAGFGRYFFVGSGSERSDDRRDWPMRRIIVSNRPLIAMALQKFNRSP